MTKTYHVVTDELVLFNEEAYLSVLQVPIASFDEAERHRVFNELFAFAHRDIELAIDISEEEQDRWYLQLVVPYELTLSDAAMKRVRRGAEALQAYLSERNVRLEPELLRNEQIFAYMKRYNPGLVVAEAR